MNFKIVILALVLSESGLVAQGLTVSDQKSSPSVLGLADGVADDSTKRDGVDTARTYQLEEVVVTATRSCRNPLELGRSVNVVTNREMSHSVYNSVAELLSQEEGIYVVGTGQNPGMLQNIFTRGASSNQTAIMVDEVRITDPSSVNNMLDLSELSLAGTDRIEIVRGAHSTLYGSSAIGGTVNIFTRRNQNPGFHANAALTLGTLGSRTSMFSENVHLSYADPIGLYFNGEITNSNIHGLDATVDTVRFLNAFKNRDKDDFDKRDLSGRIGFHDDRFDIYASFMNANHETDLDKGAFKDDDNYTLSFRRDLVTYGAGYKINDQVSLKYLGGFSTMRRFEVDDSSVVDWLGNTDHTYSDGSWRGSMATNELQANCRVNGLTGVIGGGLYSESMTSQTYFYTRSSYGVYESRTNLDMLKLSASTANLFTHVEFSGGLLVDDLSKVTLALGLRVNDHNAYGTNLTHEISTTLRVSEHSLLYGSYSSGFNAPSLYQLHAPDKNYLSGITRGNRSLKPETSRSYEIGLKQAVTNDFHLSVAYFHTVVDDAIEYVYLWDKNIGIDSLGSSWLRDDYRGDSYLNVGKQMTSGIEVSVRSQVSARLAFSVNMSLLSGALTYDPARIDPLKTGGNHVQLFSNGAFLTKEVESVGLVRRPNTANLSLTFTPAEQLSTRMDVRYVGSRNDIQYNAGLGPYGALGTKPVAEYTLVDLTTSYRFDPHFSITARMENVLNTKYSEIIGYTTRGRGLYLKTMYSY